MQRKGIYMLVVVMSVLSSHSFFNPFEMVNTKWAKLIFYVICLIGIMLAQTSKIKNTMPQTHKTVYGFVIFTFIVSIISCTMFQEQPLKATIITYLPYFFSYTFLFTLLHFRIPNDNYVKLLLTLQVLSALMYFVNLSVFPASIFGEESETVDDSRGMLRISMIMEGMQPFGLLYSLNQYIERRKTKHLLWFFFSVVMIVAKLSRQMLLLSVALSLLLVWKKVSIKAKFSTICSIIFFYFLVLPQIPLYQSFVEFNEMQSELREQNDGDVREKAVMFYLVEYQKNSITPFVGNGVPSLDEGKYGEQWSNDCEGRLFVDVGWAGYFWLFGGISTVALMFFFFLVIREKMKSDEQYLSFFIIYIFFTSFASAPILYHYQVVLTSIVLSMIYQSSRQTKPGKRIAISRKT